MRNLNKLTLLFAATLLVGGCDKKSESDTGTGTQIEAPKAKAPTAEAPAADTPKTTVTAPKPATPDAPADGWKRHAFASHGFSIESPGEPRLEKSTIKSEFGDAPMETTSMSARGVAGSLAVAVSIFPIPDGVKANVEQALKGATNTTLGGGTAVLNEAVTIGGHSARRLTFTSSTNFGASLGPVSGDMLHIYVAPNKMIAVGGIHKNGDTGRAKITARFIDSLQFDDADAK